MARKTGGDDDDNDDGDALARFNSNVTILSRNERMEPSWDR